MAQDPVLTQLLQGFILSRPKATQGLSSPCLPWKGTGIGCSDQVEPELARKERVLFGREVGRS